MSLFLHDDICPACGQTAILNNDTSKREIWIECNYCGFGTFDPLIMEEKGYVTDEEQAAIYGMILDWPTPYKSAGEFEEQICWVEFIKAISLDKPDFTPEDEFVLNGVHFKVMRVDSVS